MFRFAQHLNETALQCVEILHYVQNNMALQGDDLSTAFLLRGVTYFGALAYVLVGWKPTVITQNVLKRVGACQRALACFAS